MDNSIKHSAGRTLLALMAMSFLCSAASAWVLLEPPSRVFDTPVIFTIDERGYPSVNDFDHGVTASVAAAGAWNTIGRTLVIAHAGPVSSNVRTGDGESSIHFNDPRQTCSRRLGCLAAALLTVKKGQKGTCAGRELVNITETDIVFEPNIPTVSSLTALGGVCTHSILIENVITHEIGHALGLDHSTDENAIMWQRGRFCWTGTVAMDDWDGIEAIYGCDLMPL